MECSWFFGIADGMVIQPYSRILRLHAPGSLPEILWYNNQANSGQAKLMTLKITQHIRVPL